MSLLKTRNLYLKKINEIEHKNGSQQAIEWIKLPQIQLLFNKSNNTNRLAQKRLTQKLKQKLCQSVCSQKVYKFKVAEINSHFWNKRMTYEFFNSLEFLQIDSHQE